MIRQTAALAAGFACMLAGCANGEPADADRRAPLRIDSVALVDTVDWEGSGARLARIEVRHREGTDTVPDVLVAEAPTVVGDTVLHGFARYGPMVTEGFRYHIRTREVTWIPTPPEHFVRVGSSPTVSPDGRFVAWVANGGGRTARAAVARWPEGEMVYLGEPVQVICGGAWNHSVEWTGMDTFEVTIDRCLPPEARFVRLRGTLEEQVP